MNNSRFRTHDGAEIGPVMLSKIAKKTGLDSRGLASPQNRPTADSDESPFTSWFGDSRMQSGITRFQSQDIKTSGASRKVASGKASLVNHELGRRVRP
jgi:hypothetical protein